MEMTERLAIGAGPESDKIVQFIPWSEFPAEIQDRLQNASIYGAYALPTGKVVLQEYDGTEVLTDIEVNSINRPKAERMYILRYDMQQGREEKTFYTRGEAEEHDKEISETGVSVTAILSKLEDDEWVDYDMYTEERLSDLQDEEA